MSPSLHRASIFALAKYSRRRHWNAHLLPSSVDVVDLGLDDVQRGCDFLVVLLELLGDGDIVEAISRNGCEDILCGVDVGADLVDDAVDLARCVFDETETSGSELAKVDAEET